MSKTSCKVWFWIFVWFTFTNILCIVADYIAGNSFEEHIIAFLLGILICLLYWELWHRPVIESKQYIIYYKEDLK